MKVVITKKLLECEFFNKLKPETQDYFKKLISEFKVFRVVDVKETVHNERVYVFSSGLKMPKKFTERVEILQTKNSL